MFYNCLKRIFAVTAIGVLLLALSGCGVKEKLANTKNEKNKSDTVSVFGESQKLQDDESSQGLAFSSEDKPLDSEESESRKDSSTKVEVTIEPDSSLRVDTTNSALDTNESSSANNNGNTDSAGNLWDSNGDGYYDIKIH